METGLKIIIGAEDQATPVFVKTSEGAKKTAEAFSKIPPAAKSADTATNSLTQSLTRVSPAGAKASAALKSVSGSSTTATQSLVNLSRVAQDAPYGFIGIANNLNPLLEGFQRLRAETGSNRLALKALGSSLLGAGGLGLAIGVVSSLLVVFGDRLFKSKSAAESAAEGTKKANEALQDYVENLSAVDQANVKGLQNAQSQLQTLNALYSASQNQNISLAERKKAVDELQEQYPKYFGNISDEIILAGGATAAYNKLSTAIIASAKARAFNEVIVENEKKLIALEKQGTQALQKEFDARQKILNTKPAVAALGVGQKLFSEDALAQANYKTAIANTNEVLKQQNAVKKENLNLSKELNAIVVKNGVDVLDPKNITAKDPTSEALKKKAEEAKREAEAAHKKRMADLKRQTAEEVKIYEERQLEIRRVLGQPIQDDGQEFRDMIKRSIIDIKPSDKLTTLRVPIVIIPEIKTNDKNLGKGLTAELVATINSSIEAASKQIQVEAFSGIGEAIGAAISGGGVGDSFKQMFSAIGGVIQQLGSQIIALSPLIAGLKKALSTLSPVGLLAAGVGLVALGSVIKKATTVKLAEGGIAYGPTQAIVGEYAGANRNPEIIAPLSKLKNLLGDFGGGNFPDYLPMHNISGDTLQLWYAKSARRQGRNF